MTADQIVKVMLEDEDEDDDLMVRDIALSSVDTPYYKALAAWRENRAKHWISRRYAWERVLSTLWPDASAGDVRSAAFNLSIAYSEMCYEIDVRHMERRVEAYLQYALRDCISGLPPDKNKTEALAKLWRTISNE